MIWNCNGKIKEIEFVYSSGFKEYSCCIADYIYACEKGFWEAGPWDWYREGYTEESSKWCDWR